jgi:putative membrane protein
MAGFTGQDRAFFAFTAVVSALALSVLAWLLLFRNGTGAGAPDLHFLPPLNAGLNATAATLLVAGRVAIARRRPDVHRVLMVAAFAASALFLAGYLAYHAVHAETKFGGEGLLRTAYLGLLASHVLLSIPVVPMALLAFYFAWRRDFRRHTRVTRVLHPVWLYVSATGVVVYLLLRPYYGA